MAFTKIRALMTKLSDNFPFLGTVTGTTVADNSITNAKFASTIAASNFSGALPAIDGSALTGLSAATTSSSDPLITTNGTLGDVFINTTSGETYICTDATTDNNVWTNVGAGTADVVPYSPGGTVASYQWSGQTGGQFNISNSIERFTYAQETGAATGATTYGAWKFWGGGANDASQAHGYMMWAMTGPGLNAGTDVIQKFAHGSSTNAVQTGNISDARVSSSYAYNEIHMYTAAGYQANSTPVNTIEKVAFANDTTSASVGDIHPQSKSGSGSSSSTHGYVVGGHRIDADATGPGLGTGWNGSNSIRRYSFSSDGDAVTMIGVSSSTAGARGWMNETHGWKNGPDNTITDAIEKYSYASDTDAVVTGDMGFSGYGSGWSQSKTKAYTMGAHFNSTNTAGSRIFAFSFINEGNQTYVGDLQINRYGAGGTNGSA